VLVDEQKQNTLDQLTNVLHPDAWQTDENYPSMQLPHIQNGYRIMIGTQLGMRGVAAANADTFAHATVAAGQAGLIEQQYRQFFSVADLASTVTGDINQQEETAERRIMLEALMKWSGETCCGVPKDGRLPLGLFLLPLVPSCFCH
jgi:hypothetical protein